MFHHLYGMFSRKFKKHLIYIVNKFILVLIIGSGNHSTEKTMDNKVLTPEESLLLIAKTIEDTKESFKEKGHILIAWGVLMFVVSISQYFLVQLELYSFIGYPCLLFPLFGGAIGIYFKKDDKKKNLPKTMIGTILETMGWVVGVNVMILGFLFSQKLGEMLIPLFLIFMAIFIILVGKSIKFKPIFISGILLNLVGFITFSVDWKYHFLIMSIASVIAFIIPGILLSIDKRREDV